jgi:hypothetical protein
VTFDLSLNESAGSCSPHRVTGRIKRDHLGSKQVPFGGPKSPTRVLVQLSDILASDVIQSCVEIPSRVLTLLCVGKPDALDRELKRAGRRALSLCSRRPAVENPRLAFSLLPDLSANAPDLLGLANALYWRTRLFDSQPGFFSSGMPAQNMV